MTEASMLESLPTLWRIASCSYDREGSKKGNDDGVAVGRSEGELVGELQTLALQQVQNDLAVVGLPVHRAVAVVQNHPVDADQQLRVRAVLVARRDQMVHRALQRRETLDAAIQIRLSHVLAAKALAVQLPRQHHAQQFIDVAVLHHDQRQFRQQLHQRNHRVHHVHALQRLRQKHLRVRQHRLCFRGNLPGHLAKLLKRQLREPFQLLIELAFRGNRELRAVCVLPNPLCDELAENLRGLGLLVERFVDERDERGEIDEGHVVGRLFQSHEASDDGGHQRAEEARAGLRSEMEKREGRAVEETAEEGLVAQIGEQQQADHFLHHRHQHYASSGKRRTTLVVGEAVQEEDELFEERLHADEAVSAHPRVLLGAVAQILRDEDLQLQQELQQAVRGGSARHVPHSERTRSGRCGLKAAGASGACRARRR